MTLIEKIEHKIVLVENEIAVFYPLAARNNAYAEGFLVAAYDELRWLKWILETKDEA